MWIPLRSVKMKGFILGFQRLVWCPKWTPASSSSFIDTTAIVFALAFLVWSSAPIVPDPERRARATAQPG